MNKFTFELDEYETIALLHAICQQSCGYNYQRMEEKLPEFHCCDYNEVIYELVKQIRPTDFENRRYEIYAEDVKSQAIYDFEEEPT